MNVIKASASLSGSEEFWQGSSCGIALMPSQFLGVPIEAVMASDLRPGQHSVEKGYLPGLSNPFCVS